MKAITKTPLSFRIGQIRLDRFMELDQLFRFALMGFLFAAMLLIGQPFKRDFPLFVTFIAFFAVNIGLVVAQNVRPSFRHQRRIWSIWLDMLFFGLFNLFAGYAPSLFFNILFLWTAFSIGWRVGTKAGTFMLTLNLVVFIVTEILSLLIAPTDDVIINSWTGLVLWSFFHLVLGYLIARAGDAERMARQREKLITKLRMFVKQGMGINVFCNFLLRELLEVLEARQVQIVLFQNDGSYVRRRMYLKNGEPRIRVDELSEGDVQRHIKAKNVHLPLFFSKRGSKFEGYQLEGNDWQQVEVDEQYRDLGAGLNRHTIIAMPLAGSTNLFGRIIICASDDRQFKLRDVLFLQKLLAVVVIFLDNMRLTDAIAEEAAATERRKIALDLHDRVIQPYVAVQIGIKGLRSKYESKRDLSESDFERLVGISKHGVDDLREIVRQLKGADEAGQAFVPAVQRFLRRFSDATGIAVDFVHDGKTEGLYGSFSSDLFQMVAEGLSNVYRHSESSVIELSIKANGKRVTITIQDEGRKGEDVGFFIPKSLSERAALRGGVVLVSPSSAGGVTVEIDLPAPEILAR